MHGKLCEICGVEYDATKAPTNHASENYTYTDNGDGTHTMTCADCGYSTTEGHSFVDGSQYIVNENFTHSFTCICGEYVTEKHTFDETTGKCVCGEKATLVSTEAEMVAALENGGNIMLTGDIAVSDEYGEGYEISKNTAIDLNGHTITGEGVFWLSGYEENIVLTISGNGTVKNTDPNFTSAICACGTLNLLGGTIEGGTDTLGTTVMSGGRVDEMNKDKNDSDDDTSYITGGYVGRMNCWGGILKISGGHVEALGIKYGTIIISGGTFGFDPTAYVDTTNYTVTESDGVWTVTKTN